MEVSEPSLPDLESSREVPHKHEESTAQLAVTGPGLEPHRVFCLSQQTQFLTAVHVLSFLACAGAVGRGSSAGYGWAAWEAAAAAADAKRGSEDPEACSTLFKTALIGVPWSRFSGI